MSKKTRIKYIGLIMLLAGVLLMAPNTAFAGGANGGGTLEGDHGSEGNWDYEHGSKNVKKYIKITAYVYNGTGIPERVSNTGLFTNNNSIGNNYVHYAANQPSDKLSYVYKGQKMDIKRGKINPTYLPFDNNGGSSLRNWFKNNVITGQNNEYINKINETINLDIDKIKSLHSDGYYFLIEAVHYSACGYACSDTFHFIGTAYEMAKMVDMGEASAYGSYPTIWTSPAKMLFLRDDDEIDKYHFIGNIFTTLNAQRDINDVKQISKSNLLKKTTGYGMNLVWVDKTNVPELDLECKIEFNSNFPLDSNGNVQMVVINSSDKDDARIATPEDIKAGNAVNCCDALLQSEQFGNNKDKLCNERPECCGNCTVEKKESNPSDCTSNITGDYQSAPNDKQTWYCLKAFDQYSPFLKRRITYNGIDYARIVCRESLTTTYPKQLKHQQSVGTYMIWPNYNRAEYSLQMDGTMTCMLSIDKAEIDATGNANNIYNYIYNEVKSMVNNGTAENWYNLNSRTNMTIEYNDDEYGGPKISLVKNSENSNVTLFDNGSSNWYSKLNSLMITIKKNVSYKLPIDSYYRLTTSGIGSKNLINMYNEINKNKFVSTRFDGGILPISYTSKTTRNKSSGAADYYRLTLKYSGLGDNNQFATTEQDYTCPYEVTFAPPTNKDDDDDVDDPHDDNNESYDRTDECRCPSDSLYPGMELNGYLLKNPQMTCARGESNAQDLYCYGGRGNNNVEYRVISLKEPFPSIEGISYESGGRKIGVNWRDRLEDTKAGSIVNTYIKNNRKVSDYNVYTLEPLYTIELNSVAIKEIRQHNKTTNYADFDFVCYDEEKGKRCISNYLNTLKTMGYITGGTCSDQNPNEFYSCADKDEPIE